MAHVLLQIDVQYGGKANHVALGVYVLLHMAVNGLLRLFVHRKTVV